MSAQPFVAHGIGFIPLRARGGAARAWALVDACDFMDVARFNWHLTDAGYAARQYGGRLPARKQEWMHRRVLNLPEGDPRQADHVNRRRLDNRRSNLRVVTDAQNKQNLTPRKGGTSAYRGVSWNTRCQRWVAQMRIGGTYRCKHVNTEDEARRLVMAWRAEQMTHATD